MRHVIWSCSTFLPSIIKIFQRVFKLQSGTKSFSNKTKGENSKSKKGRVVILVHDTSSVLFYISTKYHQNIPKSIQVKSGQEVLRRRWHQQDPSKNSMFPFTPHLHPHFGSGGHNEQYNLKTSWENTRSKILWGITEGTRNQWIITVRHKGDNTKSKKGRVVILVRDMSSGPVRHFCQVPSKYSKGYSSYRAVLNLFQIKQRVRTPKVRKAELSFLYMTRRLSCSTFLPNIIKIFQRVFKLRVDKKFYADADTNRIRPKTVCSPSPPTSTPTLVVGDIMNNIIWKLVEKILDLKYFEVKL